MHDWASSITQYSMKMNFHLVFLFFVCIHKGHNTLYYSFMFKGSFPPLYGFQFQKSYFYDELFSHLGMLDIS